MHIATFFNKCVYKDIMGHTQGHCTLSLKKRIFMIIYDVLQHYYDNRCSPESWSSLLTAQLADLNKIYERGKHFIESKHTSDTTIEASSL